MKVRVVAPFLIPGADREGVLEIPAGTKVGQILKRSNSLLRILPVMVIGKQVKATHILKDGDTLVVIAPISGG